MDVVGINFVKFFFQVESVTGSFLKKIQLDFNMRTICTICALALASSLILVSGEDKKKDEKDKKDVGTVIGIDLGTTYSW